MLPTSGHHLRGDGHRGVATHRTDEKPGGCRPLYGGAGVRGTLPQLLPFEGADQGGEGRPDGGWYEAPVCGPGDPEQGGLHRVSPAAPHLVLCHRRGALHLGVGPRLQARIPPAARRHRRYQPPRPNTDPHRFGHPQGAAGHHQEPAHGEGQPVCILLQPPQPLLRGAPQALRDAGAAQGNHPLHPRQRGQERHHLLSHAQARGGLGGGAAAQRHQGTPLPCRP